MLKKNLLAYLIIVTCYMFHVTSASAIELNSPRFKIELNEINIQPKVNIETIYTLNSIFGNKGMDNFRKYGYTFAEPADADTINFSLSQSLTTFIASGNNRQIDKTDYSISRVNGGKFSASLLQEYPLINSSGEEIELQYSLNDDTFFRSLPKEDSKQSATMLLSGKEKSEGEINFRLITSADREEGTYDTVLNFIVSPN